MRKFYIILIKASKIVNMYVIEKIQVYLRNNIFNFYQNKNS